jgi:hypothetical protein
MHASPPALPALPSSATWPAPGCRDDLDDELLAALYVRMWIVATGRSLPRDVPPDQLTTEELISFWGDELYPAPGRHAAPAPPRGR